MNQKLIIYSRSPIYVYTSKLSDCVSDFIMLVVNVHRTTPAAILRLRSSRRTHLALALDRCESVKKRKDGSEPLLVVVQLLL